MLAISAGCLLACGSQTAVLDQDADGDPDSFTTPGGSTETASSSSTSTDTDTPSTSGPLCAPTAEWQTPHVLEGEEALLTISCAGQLQPAGLELSVHALPDEATVDLDTWTARWSTGPADAGRYEPLISVSDGAGGLPESVSAPLWVADDPSNPANVTIDPEIYTEEWGLPIFHITGSGFGSDYAPITLVFDGETYDAEAKIRGAASYSYPKSSYTLRFAADHELDASAWGIENRRDHLVLISQFDDNSYARQKLIYDLWAAMAEYWGEERLVPRTFFAVVYMNGAYHGLYLAIDRIGDEFVSDMGLSKEGNLYKAVSHDANFYLTNSGGGAKSTYHDGLEKKEGEPLSGEGAWDDIDALVAFTGGTDSSGFAEVADDWMRVDEYMDWWFLVHVSESADSAGKNSYHYNDPTQAMEFRYIPWDFNHSWGQDWRTLRVASSQYNDFRGTNAVFNHFFTDAALEEEMWERYRAMRADGPLHDEWATDVLDGYYALIDRSAERDWDAWGDQYSTYSGWSSRTDFTDHEGERDYLYAWIASRNAYLGSWYD